MWRSSLVDDELLASQPELYSLESFSQLVSQSASQFVWIQRDSCATGLSAALS